MSLSADSPWPHHLPAPGFRVRLASDTQVFDQGRTLVGGDPLRAVYLARDAHWPATAILTVTTVAEARLARIVLDRGLGHPEWDNHAPTAPPASEITLVVPVYSRATELSTLLASAPQGMSIIVVDDHSPDPRDIAAVAAHHSAHLIRLERNLGPAAARNAGLAEVTTPYVLFADSDVELTADVVGLARHFADPAVAMVAPRVISRQRARHTSLISHYEKSHGAPDMGVTAGLVRPGGVIGWLPAACLMARRDALREGFDEKMRIAEDVDLVWRLVNTGQLVRYDPSVMVYHDDRSSVSGWFRRRVAYGTGAHDLSLRHGSAMTPALFTPWTLAMTLALVPLRWWSLPLALTISLYPALKVTASLSTSEAAVRVGVRQPLRMLRGVVLQGSALVLRHWWPVTVIASLFFRTARRLLGAAVVVDAWHSLGVRRKRLAHRGERESWSMQWNPLVFLLMRRADDLAYGAGIWQSALSGRSVRSLLPRMAASQRPHHQ